MSSIIQFKRTGAAIWTSANPILTEGELGLELDTGKFKFGDGTSHWSALPYAVPPGVTLPPPNITISTTQTPGTLAAWTNWESGAIAMTGVVAGQVMAVGVPTTWPANALVLALPVAADQVKLRVFNNSGATVTIGATLFKLTALGS